MELKTAIRILKEWVKQSRAFEKDFNLEKIISGTLGKKRIDALDTVLKVLDMPEEEVVFYGTRSCGKTTRRTYEMGLIVGIKRERKYWESKIKEKIETLEKQGKAELESKDVLVLPNDTAYLAVRAEYYHKKEVLKEILKGE